MERFRNGTRLVTVVALAMLPLVAGAGCRSISGGQTVGQAIDDKTITTQVKARLAAAEPETLAQVDVDTVNGVVYLTGIVDTAQMKSRAESIARSEEGVQRVVNNLQLGSR